MTLESWNPFLEPYFHWILEMYCLFLWILCLRFVNSGLNYVQTYCVWPFTLSPFFSSLSLSVSLLISLYLLVSLDLADWQTGPGGRQGADGPVRPPVPVDVQEEPPGRSPVVLHLHAPAEESLHPGPARLLLRRPPVPVHVGQRHVVPADFRRHYCWAQVRTFHVDARTSAKEQYYRLLVKIYIVYCFQGIRLSSFQDFYIVVIAYCGNC